MNKIFINIYYFTRYIFYIFFSSIYKFVILFNILLSILSIILLDVNLSNNNDKINLIIFLGNKITI